MCVKRVLFSSRAFAFHVSSRRSVPLSGRESRVGEEMDHRRATSATRLDGAVDIAIYVSPLGTESVVRIVPLNGAIWVWSPLTVGASHCIWAFHPHSHTRSHTHQSTHTKTTNTTTIRRDTLRRGQGARHATQLGDRCVELATVWYRKQCMKFAVCSQCGCARDAPIYNGVVNESTCVGSVAVVVVVLLSASSFFVRDSDRWRLRDRDRLRLLRSRSDRCDLCDLRSRLRERERDLDFDRCLRDDFRSRDLERDSDGERLRWERL